EQLLDVVRQLHEQGVTVVVVEQSVNTALSTAARAYFLEKGTLRFHGLAADLLERPDLLRSIFLEGATSNELVPPARVAVVAPQQGDTPRVVLATEGLTKRFAGVMALDDVSVQ